MIVSSEYHNLLEQFKAAHAVADQSVKALSEYMKIPNRDRAIEEKLLQKMDEDGAIAQQIWLKLEKVQLDK